MAAWRPALNSQAIKYNERQAIPSKRIIYGTAQVGGALFFEDVKPPYLYQGFLICAKKITAFKQDVDRHPGDRVYGLHAEHDPDADRHHRPAQLSGPAAGFVSARRSRPGDRSAAGAGFHQLDSEFRQRGIATAVVRYDYGADFDEYTALWGQVARPNPLWLVDGIAIPDPRVTSHVLEYDPSDLDAAAAAEATWSFSNNAALVQAHYLTQRFGGRIDPRRLDWDKTAEAADWDDGLVRARMAPSSSATPSTAW
jgi:hypothetical protein